jgi:hypothetical protein
MRQFHGEARTLERRRTIGAPAVCITGGSHAGRPRPRACENKLSLRHEPFAVRTKTGFITSGFNGYDANPGIVPFLEQSAASYKPDWATGSVGCAIKLVERNRSSRQPSSVGRNPTPEEFAAANGCGKNDGFASFAFPTFPQPPRRRPYFDPCGGPKTLGALL